MNYLRKTEFTLDLFQSTPSCGFGTKYKNRVKSTQT